MEKFNAIETMEILSEKEESVEESFENDNPLASDEGKVINHDELSEQFEDEDCLDKMAGCPIDENNGHWSGERGNSDWIPDNDYKPSGQFTNPENKTWSEVKEQYGFEKVTFKDGEPDFSQVAKVTVEIDNFTDKRIGKGGNFDQADQKLVGKSGMSKEELLAFKENYTWHEKSDCKTLELVPTVIHGNISHNGGVSQYKNNI